MSNYGTHLVGFTLSFFPNVMWVARNTFSLRGVEDKLLAERMRTFFDCPTPRFKLYKLPSYLLVNNTLISPIVKEFSVLIRTILNSSSQSFPFHFFVVFLLRAKNRWNVSISVWWKFLRGPICRWVGLSPLERSPQVTHLTVVLWQTSYWYRIGL